jgi:acetyl-CoA C-acetyltransferase
MADQLIGYSEFEIVVAGGMESMTNGPYLLPGARTGYRYGDNSIVDATQHDALFCSFDQLEMGDATDRYSRARGIGRAEQDEYSAMSHERATTARKSKNGLFDDEVVPVEVRQRRGEPLLVTDDEGVRPGTTAESLGRMRPAFAPDGTITAGSATQISDEAAAVDVMSRAKGEELACAAAAVARARLSFLTSQPDGGSSDDRHERAGRPGHRRHSRNRCGHLRPTRRARRDRRRGLLAGQGGCGPIL